MTHSIDIEVATAEVLDRAVRAEIIRLCEAAYNEGFARMFEDFSGSVHILARDDRGALVSHAMWVMRWLQPEGHAPLRYGLRRGRSDDARSAGARVRHGGRWSVSSKPIQADPIWELAALSPAVPEFYARRGWEPWLGPLAIRRDGGLEPTPSDELVMIWRLPRTPATMVTTSLLTAEWRIGEVW